MKKISKFILALISAVILFYPLNTEAAYEEKIKYANYLLVNLDTGQILLEKDAKQQVAIASLTKMMTVIVALEAHPDISKKVIITEKMLSGLVAANASVAGFYLGEKVTIEDLIYGALLPSGADATKALAVYTSGSEKAYVALMNEKAGELGMDDTVYKNSSGLDANGQHSSAYDQMLLLKYCLSNKKFVEAFTAVKYTTSDKTHKFKSTLRYYLDLNEISAPFITGGKTGYEDLAGICLASYVDSEGDRLLFVGLGNRGNKAKAHRFSDDINVYTYYIDNYELQTVYKASDILYTVKPAYTVQKEVVFDFAEDIRYYLPNDYDPADVNIEISGVIPVSYKTTVEESIANYTITYQNEVIKTGTIRLSEQLTTNIWLQGLELSAKHQLLVPGILLFLILGLVMLLLVSIKNSKDKRQLPVAKRKKKRKASLSHR